MTVSVAKNKTELKKRMQRFFSLGSPRKEAMQMLSFLLEKGDVLAFGGVVRDIALYGVKSFSSDLDLIFVGNRDHFHNELQQKGKKNKFGGYRLKVGDWDIDVWHIEDTWAFKHRKANYKNELSLLDTTIMSWDSVLYSLSKNRVYCHDGYFEDLAKGYLDLVLFDNPNKFGAMIRIMRCFVLKEATVFSPRIIEFLNENLCQHSIDEILDSEKRSYHNTYLNRNICLYIAKVMSENKGSFLPAYLQRYNKTNDMFS